MKTPEQARAILAAAHKTMPADLIAAHAQHLAAVVACNDKVIAELCATIAILSGLPCVHIPVEQSWPSVYDASAANG